MQHEDLTRRIIAAAMKVHSTLNNPVKAGLVEKWNDWKFTFAGQDI